MKKYIENETNYAYIIKHTKALSFKVLLSVAESFINGLPETLKDHLYDSLRRGVCQLSCEPEMNMYIHAFGRMHEAKLHHAFKRLPNEFLHYPTINIIDYGCGQALGTICYADFLGGNKLCQSVRRITLIEPSEMALKRAALHVSYFFPNAEIVTIPKCFDDLKVTDINVETTLPTLHIFSNVIDLANDYFNLEKFAKLANSCILDQDQIICVEPCFEHIDKDNRMQRFVNLLDIEVCYQNIFPKGTFRKNHDWSCNVVIGGKNKKLSQHKIENIQNSTESELSSKQAIVVTNKMSARALKEKHGVIKFVKNPKSGKVFFTCGSIIGYVSPQVQSNLNRVTIDDLQYAEISVNGQKAVPCLLLVKGAVPF